jgi:hypothetical protein
MEGLSILMILSTWIASASQNWKWNRDRIIRISKNRLTGLSMILLTISLGTFHSYGYFKSDDQRLQKWGYEGPSYNKSFADLIDYLETSGWSKKTNCTLVSPDLHVLHYWTMFGPKTCFYPEPWATTIKDKELEQRFVQMLRFFGVKDRAKADELLNDYFYLYLVSCARFQANCSYHPEPINKYTSGDKALIRNGAWWRSWQLALPSNARKTILGRFDSCHPPSPSQLGDHVVILPKASKFKMLAVPSSHTTIFENDSFIVAQATVSHVN